MIRTLIFLILLVVCLIIILPIGLICKLIQGNDKFAPYPWFANYIVNHPIPKFITIGGCDLRIIGRENIPDGAVMFVGNHQGIFDALLALCVFGRIPVIIAKKEAKKIPIVHLWMTMIHSIFIDRGNVRQSLACIKEMQEYLEHGFSALIFPEGTRSRGPEMGEFKSGSFKAAIKAKVPVVPFVIDGTYKVYENQKYLKKAPVYVSILPAIELDGSEKTSELAEKVQNLIRDEQKRIRDEQ